MRVYTVAVIECMAIFWEFFFLFCVVVHYSPLCTFCVVSLTLFYIIFPVVFFSGVFRVRELLILHNLPIFFMDCRLHFMSSVPTYSFRQSLWLFRIYRSSKTSVSLSNVLISLIQNSNSSLAYLSVFVFKGELGMVRSG